MIKKLLKNYLLKSSLPQYIVFIFSKKPSVKDIFLLGQLLFNVPDD